MHRQHNLRDYFGSFRKLCQGHFRVWVPTNGIYVASRAPILPHTHQTLLSADVFQLNLRVLQFLGEGLLNALGLQEPRLSVLQLSGETDH